MTPDTLRQMIECASKATPGPWEWCGDNILQSIRGDEILSATDDGRSWGMHRPMMQHHWDGATAEANRDHIAACDPQTIQALCRIALAAQRLRDQWTIPAYLDDALREAGLTT